jgi:chemotaxis response regulator CheB
MAAPARGIKALQTVLSALPASFPALIAVVQHRSARLLTLLTQELARHTPLAVKLAKSSETMQQGTVYLAPSGMGIVQDEATSECRGMLYAVIETGCVDWVLPSEMIGPHPCRPDDRLRIIHRYGRSPVNDDFLAKRRVEPEIILKIGALDSENGCASAASKLALQR